MTINKIVILVFSGFALTSALSGQSTTAVLEANQVFAADGSALTFSSVINEQPVLAFHGVTNKTAQQLSLEFTSLDSEFLKTVFGSFSWNQMSSSASPSVEWINSALPTPVGSRAIVAIMNAFGPDSILPGTQIAFLVAPTGPITTENVTHAFGAGQNAWSVVLGESGSVTLATAVPEPTTYALALGVGAFGLILMRRRRK